MREPFDLIAGACRYVDVAGNLLQVMRGNPSCLMDFLDLFRYYRSYLTQPEVFWSCKLMHVCGILREDLFFAFDHEYWLRAVTAGFCIRHVDYETACFRRHALQKTNQWVRSLLEDVALTREYAEQLAPRLAQDAQHEICKGIKWLSAKVFYLQSQEAARSRDLAGATYYWLRGVQTALPDSLWTLEPLRALKRTVVSALTNRK